MNLRAASKELKKYAERTLKRDRKCLKESLYFAETYKSNHVRLGTPPLQSQMIAKVEEFDQLLEEISLIGKKEIHMRCEFRKTWCDSMMELLMKNTHIKPTTLKIYGMTGDLSLFHAYVAQTPSLQYLIFEVSYFRCDFYVYFRSLLTVASCWPKSSCRSRRNTSITWGRKTRCPRTFATRTTAESSSLASQFQRTMIT
jgi:hypothetical protein